MIGRTRTAAGARLLLPLLLAGCAQDMFKATPFASGEHPEVRGPAEERINLWPFVYHRPPATSFLWPLGEVTDTTWALRPLLARYDRSLDIAWPVIQLREDGREGFVLGGCFWGKDRFWLTPLFAPVFIHANDSWSLLPLFSFRYPANPEGEGWFGTLPYVRYWRGDERTTIVAPPLFLCHEKEDGRTGWIFSPPYFRHRDQAGDTLGIPLVLTFWSKDSFVSPVYFRSGTGISKATGIPPLLVWWCDEWFFSLPLFRRRAGGRTETFVLPLLSLLRRDSMGEATEVHLALSTIAFGKGPGRTLLRALPLVSYEEEELHGHLALPLLGYFSSHDPTESWWSILGWTRKTGENGLSSVSFFPILPDTTIGLFERERGYGKLGFSSLYSLPPGREPEKREHSRLSLLWFFNRKAEWDRGEPGKNRYETTYLWPMVDWERTESGERSFDLLFGLVYDWDARPAREGGGEYRRTRILWRLWHDEREGDRRSLDVFPFFTYDRDGEASKTVSWLYTFFRYERRGQERGLNLLFLPQIKWGRTTASSALPGAGSRP